MLETTLLDLSQIKIADRQRTSIDPDKLNELIESIREIGNITPPTVERESLSLIAGERRFRAISALADRGEGYVLNGQEIPPGKIAVFLISANDLNLRKRIELYENIHREDLHWKDKVRAVKELVELRKENDSSVTLSALSKEVFDTSAPTAMKRVQVWCKVAEGLESEDPDITRAPSLSAAERVIELRSAAAKRQAFTNIVQGLAEKEEEISETGEGEAPAQREKETHSPRLFLGDAIEVMKQLPSIFSCILTDPPYGITANDFGTQAGIAHKYADDEDYFWPLMESFAELSYSLTLPEAHLYLFCDIRNFFPLSDLFARSSWRVFPTPLIWAKGQGMLPWPEHGPRRTYETILFAVKGNRPVITRGQSDVIAIPSVKEKVHAAQKPVALYSELLSRSCTLGDYVLDPFCGSGPIFPAAKELGLIAYGIERNEEAHAHAEFSLNSCL